MEKSFEYKKVNDVDKNIVKEVDPIPIRIPKLPLPFSHRLNKKVDRGKFSKFMAMLKQLTVNMTLVDALDHMSGYAKFIKDLVTKRITVSYEPVDNLHYFSAIATRSLVQKKADLGAFTVPCTIVEFSFMNLDKSSTYDLGDL